MAKKLIFGLSCLLLGLLIGFAVTIKFGSAASAQSQEVKPQNPVALESTGLEDAIINVANKTGKSVVSISTEHTTKFKGGKRFYFGQPGGSPFGEDEQFRRFFDEFFGEMPDREYKQIGLGSGVIIDPEGYILTNQHVIQGADKITVTLSDGREFPGEIKGQDARSDLAVIKISAHDLPVATLGDSNSLKIGQWVVAIGNPFGFAMQNPEATVTCGVISALHRSLGRVLSRDRDYNDLVQTDAAINPGNSGGPLVNLKGEIVGINVAIFSTSGGYQGIGFAVPVNSAKSVIPQLIAGKKIAYGWLGVTVQDLTDDLAKYFGLTGKNGVLVAKVLEGGPAQKGAMKESDIIKRFDNKSINKVTELLTAVAHTEVGRKVKVAVVRDKKELVLEMQIGERPEEIEEGLVPEKEGGIEEEPKTVKWRGLEVADLGAQLQRGFKTTEKTGVIIVNIEPSSPAEQAGIMIGDVILEINRQSVKNLSDYRKITNSLKGDCLIRTSRGYSLIKESAK